MIPLRPLLFAVFIIFLLSAHPAAQSSNLKLVGPKGDPNPVVNEPKPNPIPIQLTVTDAGQPVTGFSFTSGSPDIASVDPTTGMVTGMKRGFATITAQKGTDSVSVFVAVARVDTSSGAKVPGDTKPDTGGRIYLSDPIGSVILKKKDFVSKADIYAGQKGTNGRTDGDLSSARFAGPTAVAVDNSAGGGVYIADTLNHSIRKIGNNSIVSTIVGNGSPG